MSELCILAKEYLDRTETFDRYISRGEIFNDEISLEGDGVRERSMAFARQVKKEIIEKAKPYWGWKEIHSAIRCSHSWYKFEPWTNIPKTRGES